MQILVTLLTLLFASRGAAAATMERGDVFAGGDFPGVVEETIYPIAWIRGSTLKEADVYAETFGLTFSPDGRLFIGTTAADCRVLIVDRSLHVTSVTRCPGDYIDGSALVFSRAGALYRIDVFDPVRLSEYAPDGAFVRTTDLGLPLDGYSADLDADQCTLYFAPMNLVSTKIGSTIHRFDVCTARRLPDLSSVPVGGGGLRVDRDGTILASSGDRILRFSRWGPLVGSYTFGALRRFGAIALDVDGSSIWCVADNQIYHLDLEAHSVVAGPLRAETFIRSLAVVDEPRAAFAPASAVPPPPVPLLGWVAFLTLGAALMALGTVMAGVR